MYTSLSDINHHQKYKNRWRNGVLMGFFLARQEMLMQTLPWKRAWGGMTSGIRSASERRLGVAEWEAGVPGAEKSSEGEGDGLVRGVRSEELMEEKSTTSPFSRTMSGRRLRLMNLTGVEEVLLSKKPAASFWALRMSLASWVRDLFSFSSMADSTGLRPARFLSPSTVMIGSKDSFDPAREQTLGLGKKIFCKIWFQGKGLAAYPTQS